LTVTPSLALGLKFLFAGGFGFAGGGIGTGGLAMGGKGSVAFLATLDRPGASSARTTAISFVSLTFSVLSK
jgi:hypothetical protein